MTPCSRKMIWLTAAAWALISGCSDKIEPGTVQPPVQTVQARTAVAGILDRPVFYEALGTVTAKESTTLSGKVMGVVNAIRVREGEWVKQEDTLVIIDQRQAAAALQGSQAQLTEAREALSAALSAKEAAKAGAALAKATYDRYVKLYNEDSATRQEFEEVQARHRQADAALSQAKALAAAALSRVEQAQAGVSGAGVMKKDTVITAPYDGRVTAKLINVGDLSSPGTPLLVIERQGGFQAELVVPEQHIGEIRTGQALKIEVPDQKDMGFLEGVIRTIVPSADPRTRSFLIKAELPQTQALRSGMFAKCYIPVGSDGLMIIPETAVIRQGQLTGYFKVDEKNTARFRLLRTGRKFDSGVEVVSGLEPGTRFVVDPPRTLADGMTVKEAS